MFFIFRRNEWNLWLKDWLWRFYLLNFDLVLVVFLNGVVSSLIGSIENHDILNEISHLSLIEWFLFALLCKSNQPLFNLNTFFNNLLRCRCRSTDFIARQDDNFGENQRLYLTELFLLFGLSDESIEAAHSLTECRVKMIFYCVIRSTGQVLSNASPFIAKIIVISEEYDLFIFAPGFVIDVRVELVVPSESARCYLSLHCFPLRPVIPKSFSISFDTTLHFLMFRSSKISLSALSSWINVFCTSSLQTFL